MWLEYWHKIGEDWTINALILVSESNSTGLAGRGVKESPIWECVELDNYICPVLHNQINLGNNVLYNLLDDGDDFIEKLSSKEIIARNSLTVIDASNDEKIALRQDFDISEDGKRLTNLKTTRRNDTTSIVTITELIDNREIEIDDLSNKREVFINDANKIRKYKCNIKLILKDGRSDRNRANHGEIVLV